MVNNRRKDRRAQRRSRDTIVTVIEEKDSCKLVSKRRALLPAMQIRLTYSFIKS